MAGLSPLSVSFPSLLSLVLSPHFRLRFRFGQAIFSAPTFSLFPYEKIRDDDSYSNPLLMYIYTRNESIVHFFLSGGNPWVK